MPRRELDELGLLVRKARKAKGLTQADLSQITGIAQSELSTLESGDKRDMLASNLEQLAHALDIGVSRLLEGFAKRRAAARRSALDEDDVETVLDLRSHEPSPA